MKKTFVVFIFFICTAALSAQDYRWNFVTALTQNDFQSIDNILKENINIMRDAEKRLFLNLTFNHSYGENTIRVLDILNRHGIQTSSYDLYLAIERNQPDNVIQSIIGRGAEPNGEILLLAMEKQRFNLARLFIQRGADVNYHYPLSRNYADGMTPLLYAAKWNNFELVKVLAENGAEINARNKNGNTALSIAQTNGNSEIYDFLTGLGAVEGAVPAAPQETAGISSLLENQAATLQPGLYRLFGGSIDIRFSGAGSSGSISYVKSGVPGAGLYRIEGNNLLLTMEGQTFTYLIVSNVSFSGNGEIWTRAGN